MYEKIPITNEFNQDFFIRKDRLESIKNELEDFCYSTEFSTKSNFPNEILFTHELKNNNAIEGYYQDLSYIIQIINNPYIIKDKSSLDKEYTRIINLYNGYKYILENNDINEKNLNILYKILSSHLLNKDELINGLYRDSDVFIFFSDNLLTSPDKGFEPQNIKPHMDELFKYINDDNNLSEVELFFKSQIIHFYMVFIHPYFDINGRTARTTSLWFLNKNKAYPYTIFNRSITYNKRDYYKFIRDVRRYRNITPFINFVALNTKLELEKEYIIRNIENISSVELTPIDKQMLQYILQNNSQNTLLDIESFYNRFNPKIKLKDLNTNIMEPLFEKKILLKNGETTKIIYDGSPNYRFSINPQILDFDKSKIKRLSIDKLYR